jgi:hypothetical protein
VITEGILTVSPTVARVSSNMTIYNNLNKWPTDERIDAIGQNGNTGEHY